MRLDVVMVATSMFDESKGSQLLVPSSTLVWAGEAEGGESVRTGMPMKDLAFWLTIMMR